MRSRKTSKELKISSTPPKNIYGIEFQKPKAQVQLFVQVAVTSLLFLLL